MQINEKQVWGRIGEVRCKWGLSYESMARQLRSAGCKISTRVLFDCINGKTPDRMPPAYLLKVIYDLWGDSPDKLLWGYNTTIIADFLNCYRSIKRNGDSFELFVNRCISIANPSYWDLATEDTDETISDDAADMECFQQIAHRFKEVRDFLGMSADDMAKLIGCNRSTIFRNESEDKGKSPTFRYLFNFCNHLGVSADYILLGEFVGLPWDIGTVLYGLPYGNQIELLNRFIEESKEYRFRSETVAN